MGELPTPQVSVGFARQGSLRTIKGEHSWCVAFVKDIQPGAAILTPKTELMCAGGVSERLVYVPGRVDTTEGRRLTRLVEALDRRYAESKRDSDW